MRTRCEAMVVDRQSMIGRRHQCRNTAKVERDGKAFCAVHDPIVLKQKEKVRDRVFEAKRRDRLRAIQDQQIGAAVRDLFRDGMDLEHIMAWVKGEEKRRAPSAKPRYKLVDKSQSAHCCFEATIVDTTKPYMIFGEQYLDRYEEVCESFSKDHAQLICDALNAFI